MDIPRKSAAKKRKVKRIIYVLITLVAVVGITLAMRTLKPAAPSASRDIMLLDTVKRGNMTVSVRGLGTLVPEEIRYVPAISLGSIEKRLAQPGAQVKAGTVILELTNPEIQQAFTDAESQLRAEGSNQMTLKVQTQKQILDQEATLAQARSDFNKAKMQFEVNDSLGKQGLKSQLEVQLSKIAAEDTESRVALEIKRLASNREEAKAKLSAEDEKVRLQLTVRDWFRLME